MLAVDFWSFVAGLALFIYAVRLLEESMKALAGRPFKKFLQRHTAHPLKAIAGGAVVTAILQSSSVVLLLTLSFVGAGVLSMRNALALVLGSNLGTTFDSWIVAWLGFRFDVETWSFPLLGVSLAGLLFFGKSRVAGWWTRFLIGFSLLFIGLAYMKEAFTVDDALSFLAEYVRRSPYWFVLYGFILTALIQSSFATMAIALAALNAQQLPIAHAAAIVVGAELGTSIKLLFGASKGTPDKRRVAWGNFYFNVLSLIAGTILLFPLIRFLDERVFPHEPLLSLVCFSSVLNLIVILVSYPLLGSMAHWLEKRVSGESLELQFPESSVRMIDDPGAVLDEVRQESLLLLNRAMRLNREALGIADRPVASRDGLLVRLNNLFSSGVPFIDEYRRLKLQQGELLELCADLLREELTPEETDRLNRLLRILRNITHSSKGIKDIRHNLKELADTANDHLFGLLGSIRADEARFYRMSENALTAMGAEGPADWDFQLAENREGQERRIANALTLLHDHSIKEYEASTLMNIYRGLYSSHKAIIQCLQDLQPVRSDSAYAAE